jgi:hypothetical protein
MMGAFFFNLNSDFYVIVSVSEFGTHIIYLKKYMNDVLCYTSNYQNNCFSFFKRILSNEARDRNFSFVILNT